MVCGAGWMRMSPLWFPEADFPQLLATAYGVSKAASEITVHI